MSEIFNCGRKVRSTTMSVCDNDCTALTCFTDGSKKESGETGALSSGWDEQHLKITWMLPHRFSSRSAGNHSGSRAIVRVHGISRDRGNNLLLGQQSRHSSGLG